MFLAGQGSSLSVCLELSKLLSLAHVKTVNLLWIKQFINVNTFLFIKIGNHYNQHIFVKEK